MIMVKAAQARGPQSRRMDHSFLSAFILLFLVLDPLGSLPVFISVMRAVAPPRRAWVACPEVGNARVVFFVLINTSRQDVLRRPVESANQGAIPPVETETHYYRHLASQAVTVAGLT